MTFVEPSEHTFSTRSSAYSESLSRSMTTTSKSCLRVSAIALAPGGYEMNSRMLPFVNPARAVIAWLRWPASGLITAIESGFELTDSGTWFTMDILWGQLLLCWLTFLLASIAADYSNCQGSQNLHLHTSSER